MNTTTFSKEEDFIKETVKLIKELTDKNPNAKIALSGGETPKKIYKELSKTNPKAKFYQVDERYIDENNENSNQKMIRETLNPKEFYFFDTSIPIKDSLKKYEKTLPQKFDLIILGIGTDGHTASIFPNSKIKKSEKVAHTKADTNIFKIKDRLTITMPLILNSKKILVLLKGIEKKDALQKHPASELKTHGDITIYFTN